MMVVSNLSLQLPAGSFTTILGPNGCGKSTLLRILNGLDREYDGRVSLDGRQPVDVPSAYIFQNYGESLLPWKDVVSNTAFPLEITGVAKRNRRSQAVRLLDDLCLDVPKAAFPYQLSGGQQQMVAIARGLITQPSLLLMDEPFGSLDYEMRYSLRDRLLSIWEKRRPTVLFVSHEVDEAVYLADRVVVLTRRPAHVAAVIDVTLPRPRRRPMIEGDSFLSHKAVVEAAFRRAIELPHVPQHQSA